MDSMLCYMQLLLMHVVCLEVITHVLPEPGKERYLLLFWWLPTLPVVLRDISAYAHGL
jgi:hypothetical protein